MNFWWKIASSPSNGDYRPSKRFTSVCDLEEGSLDPPLWLVMHEFSGLPMCFHWWNSKLSGLLSVFNEVFNDSSVRISVHLWVFPYSRVAFPVRLYGFALIHRLGFWLSHVFQLIHHGSFMFIHHYPSSMIHHRVVLVIYVFLPSFI